MEQCPECGSDEIRHFKHFDECVQCFYREQYGEKVKRKPGKAFMMMVRK